MIVEYLLSLEVDSTRFEAERPPRGIEEAYEAARAFGTLEIPVRVQRLIRQTARDSPRVQEVSPEELEFLAKSTN
jgi:hypothetical protein